MINPTQEESNTYKNKRLLSNIFLLWILQGANYILPLLTVPYLVRVLGAEYFGLLAFANATIGYFMLITDYGFNLSATRLISIHRDNPEKINQIFSAVMIIKVILMLFSLGLLVLIVFGFEKFSHHKTVYFLSFGMVIGQVLFPVWFFQGLEKMKYMAYLNILVKVIFTSAIFMFVKERADYLYVPLLTSMGFIITGIYSLYLVKRKFNVRFKLQKIAILKAQLNEGWHIFISSISISFYTISSTFILGFFANNTVVGHFVAAEKIIQAVKGIYLPVSQAMYPYISKRLYKSQQDGMDFVYKVSWLIAGAMLSISLLLFFFAAPIVNFILGGSYKESIILVQVMSFLPFVIALSNIFGVQVMLNLGYKKAFSRILLIAAFFGVSLNLILVSVYKDLGSSIAVLVVETFVTMTMFLYLLFKLRVDK